MNQIWPQYQLHSQWTLIWTNDGPWTDRGHKLTNERQCPGSGNSGSAEINQSQALLCSTDFWPPFGCLCRLPQF